MNSMRSSAASSSVMTRHAALRVAQNASARARLWPAVLSVPCFQSITGRGAQPFSGTADAASVAVSDYLRQFVNFEVLGVPAGAGVADEGGSKEGPAAVRHPHRAGLRFHRSHTSTLGDGAMGENGVKGAGANGTSGPARGGGDAGQPGEGPFSLGRMHRLMQALGSPLEKYKVIHVAGTKGKGSTTHFLASILREAGLLVGQYTSPHVLHLGERIVVGGCASARPCSSAELAALVSRHAAAVDAAHERELQQSHGRQGLSHFEVLTALAFKHFEEQQVDVAVVEVGLGGATDATNVVPPSSLLAAVITEIGLDHVAALGGSISSITRAKAGIVKPGRPAIIAQQSPLHPSVLPLLLDIAAERGAPAFYAGPPAVTWRFEASSAARDKEDARERLPGDGGEGGEADGGASASGTGSDAGGEAGAEGSSAVGAPRLPPSLSPLLPVCSMALDPRRLAACAPALLKSSFPGLCAAAPSRPSSAPAGRSSAVLLPGLPLAATFQAANAAAAAATALVLREEAGAAAEGLSLRSRLTLPAIRRGLCRPPEALPGRLQLLEGAALRLPPAVGAVPPNLTAVVLDGAHTGESAAALAVSLRQMFCSSPSQASPENMAREGESSRRENDRLVLPPQPETGFILILAMAADKEHSAFCRFLLSTLPTSLVIATQVPIASGKTRTFLSSSLQSVLNLVVDDLQTRKDIQNNPVVESSDTMAAAVSLALDHARAQTKKCVLVVTGSLHAAGAFLKLMDHAP